VVFYLDWAQGFPRKNRVFIIFADFHFLLRQEQPVWTGVPTVGKNLAILERKQFTPFLCFVLSKLNNMLYLSMVDTKDALAEFGSSFLIQHSLHRPKAMYVLTIKSFSFAQHISIWVEKDANNGSKACHLQSAYHDRSSLITDFFMLERQIIVGKAQRGLSLLLYGEFAYFPPLSRVDGAGACMISIWGTALFTMLFTPLPILTVVTLMSSMLSVRVGVLLPTPSTPYLESYQSLCGTFTSLVVLWFMARLMTRLPLALRSSVTEISRFKG